MQLSKNSALIRFFRYLQNQPHVLEMDYEYCGRHDDPPNNICMIIWCFIKYFLIHLPLVATISAFILYIVVIAPIDAIYSLFRFGSSAILYDDKTVFSPSLGVLEIIVIIVIVCVICVTCSYLMKLKRKYFPNNFCKIEWKD